MSEANTVMGHPERVFREAWISVLWKAMMKTGKGYRRPKAPTNAQRRAEEERTRKAAEQLKAA